MPPEHLTGHRRIALALGVSSAWLDSAPEWQKSSAMYVCRGAVRQYAQSRPTILEAEKFASGWKYGPVKTRIKKSNP